MRPLLTPVCLLYLAAAAARVPEPYRINVHTAPPSSHIYHMLVDRVGYLWMGTPQGVVKYNGYELNVFDIASGLPGNDIWGLHEDKKGRIWLSCICPSLGYIYHNKFKTPVIEDPPPRLYPLFWNYNDGVFLYSQYNQNRVYNKFYIEHNDTMHGYTMEAIAHAFYEPGRNELFYISSAPISGTKGYRYVFAKKPGPAGITTRAHYRISRKMPPYGKRFFFNKYMLLYEPGRNELLALNMVDTTWHVVDPAETSGQKTDKIFYQNDRALYMLAGSFLYSFDQTFRQTAPYKLSVPVPAQYITTVFYDSLWGGCIGTSNQGAYISYDRVGGFSPVSWRLPGYRYAGHSLDNSHYWWNRQTRSMACIDSAGRAKYYQYDELLIVLKIVPWTREKSLLLHYQDLYILDHHTGDITPFFHNRRVLFSDAPDDYAKRFMRYLDIAVADSNELFLLSRSGLYRYYRDKDSVYATLLDDSAKKDIGEAYTSITYDPLQKALWVYNDNAMIRYGRDSGGTVVKEHFPGQPYIRHIEKIMIDARHGNIFLKEFDRLLVFNIYTRKYRLLHKNINLAKSLVYLYGDTLIAAGRFGVVISRITGPNQLSAPVLYGNIKNMEYNDVMDMQVTSGQVILNTDKGLLTVPMPSAADFASGRGGKGAIPYRFVFGYSGNVHQVHNGDTLHLDQKSLKLQLDVINPSGNGTLKYQYYMAGVTDRWTYLSGNELMLPELIPGQFCRFSVRASDQVWRSDRMDVYLYVVPYWWQTATAKRIIYSTSILTIVCLVWLIAYTTKRIVVRNNIKRNLHMEMELKSIYAQINPHFIFNTLNSALLLIETRKIEDAHRHVSRFSKLLRAYMKSSRNRFITIADEVENLRNYIELQQIRFKGKFDYEIVLDESVEAWKIRMPSLLLQPIVENAINHGLFHRQGKGFLSIVFKKGSDKHEIVCTIEDDGIGRKQSKSIRNGSSLKGESYGDQLIEDLVRIFNKYERMNISIEYTDKETPASGTLVTLSIKRGV